MLFLQYLCMQNQMKTVKTLHFDFGLIGVSLSLSLVYVLVMSMYNRPFVRFCIYA